MVIIYLATDFPNGKSVAYLTNLNLLSRPPSQNSVLFNKNLLEFKTNRTFAISNESNFRKY